MSKCLKCNVNIKSSVDICPLCKGIIEKKEENDVFPVVETKFFKHKIIFKILFLCSVLSSIICLFLNYVTGATISWAWFVIGGIASFWVTLSNALSRRKFFLKMMFIEIVILIITSCVWDYFTGRLMWSINYVLPFLCTIYSLIMLIMRLFVNKQFRENIFLITLNSAMGLIPGFLIIFNVSTVKWPAITSVIISLFVLLFMIVFNRRQLKQELIKRFHI